MLRTDVGKLKQEWFFEAFKVYDTEELVPSLGISTEAHFTLEIRSQSDTEVLFMQYIDTHFLYPKQRVLQGLVCRGTDFGDWFVGFAGLNDNRFAWLLRSPSSTTVVCKNACRIKKLFSMAKFLREVLENGRQWNTTTGVDHLIGNVICYTAFSTPHEVFQKCELLNIQIVAAYV